MKKLGFGLLVILFMLVTFTSCDDPNSELIEKSIDEAPYDGGEEDEDDPVSSGGGSGG